MDPRIRLLAATAVMLIGLGLALCFRRPPGESTLTVPAQSGPLAAGTQPAAQSFAVAPAPRELPVTPPKPQRTTTNVTPSDRPAPPPEFPKSYLGSDQSASTRWGASMAAMLPETASAPLTHKIVDGDTLPALAERYLGSSSRAMEIYQANRDLLKEGPNVLYVDKVLKMPRNDQASARP